MKLPAVDRRTLLIGGGAGIGLVVGFLAWPRRDGSPLLAGKKDRLVNAYLRIGIDDRVTLAVPQAEVGQGIWTALAQIAADELGASFDRMAVEPAPFSDAYANRMVEVGGMKPTRITALGTSVRAFEAPIRHAAAAARDLLVRAAADRWDVRAAECDTVDQMVVHEGKALRFGEVAEAAAKLAPSDQVPLRDPASGRLMGQSLPRVELGAKSDGTLRFVSDVRLPGMLFASARIAPRGGRIVGHDDRAPRMQKGFHRLIAQDGWVAAVGDTWWAAERALDQAAVQRSGPVGDHRTLAAQAFDLLDNGERRTIFERGNYAASVVDARPLAATYAVAPLPHWSLEAPASVARFSGDRLEVWTATRVPDLVRAAVAKVGGVEPREVSVYPMPLGDGSGTGFDTDVAMIAVELARQLGRPVSLALSPQEAQHLDPVRPPTVTRMTALPNPQGGLSAWSMRVAGASGLDHDLAAASGGVAAPFSQNASAPPYGIPAIRAEAIDLPMPVRGGYWRGGDDVPLTFATESFIDEMARTAGIEPLSYRIAMLGGAPRLARVLTTAAAIGGWDGGGAGSSMGIACASLQGSHIALVATAAMGADQHVDVSKLVAVVDCGRIVNQGLVRQQVEGGLLAGLAAAALPAPEFRTGMIRASTFAGKPFERLGKVPDIQVELIGSRSPSGGVSGLGVAVVAPAVANALASSTGRRLRNLPFDPMAA